MDTPDTNFAQNAEPSSEYRTRLDALGRDDLLSALRHVANECQRNPMDSVRDILNEAFDTYDLPIHAEWADDPENPISIRI
jgi:hypothetical protein